MDAGIETLTTEFPQLKSQHNLYDLVESKT